MLKTLLTALSLSFAFQSAAMAQARLGAETVAIVQNPWAIAALPQGGFLVTEKEGQFKYVDPAGGVAIIAGAPAVDARGQVGLHDVALAPDFAQSRRVYLTWVAGPSGGALHLGYGTLDLASFALLDFRTVWRANTAGGDGHPGAMIAFSPDGFLYLTSGDRQLGSPAQTVTDSRGKILRLTLEGQPAAGNPYAEAPEVWSMGHRNPYGLAFDAAGVLWSHEMGPRGGDEFNRIEVGKNYGWPVVSEGTEYNGRAIPDHASQPAFVPPLVAWTPVIAPAGMIYYTGDVFGAWTGSFLIGGLASQALVQVQADGNTAREVARWDMGTRIRDVVADAKGDVYLLEDGSDARLMKLTR